MLRFAIIRPGEKTSLYEAAMARTEAFRVTHVVGATQLEQTVYLAAEDALIQSADQFDACVVHSVVGKTQLTKIVATGKPILLDMPWHEIVTLDGLAKSCRVAGVRLAVSQPRRLTPYAMAIRNELEAGHLGQPGLVRIHLWEHTPAFTDTAQRQLADLFVQELDLACWFFGSPPETVFGQAIRTEGVIRGWQGHLGFEAGMALVECALHPGNSYYSASVIGSSGAAYADDHRNTNLMYQDGTRGFCVTGASDWLRLQLESFANALVTDAKDRTVQDAQTSLAIQAAALESAATDRVSRLVGGQYELQ